eukprot:TRINITY_DN9986_c0_g1_i1.p1 TRINITY_DN9986_c0_g1~~TRINITY_DN9986_c0_g1_i1.p1  ORF type:complete len:405 (+),score=111.41 TRINITY_DN9986_c0_g1_i1:95-1309(+)
MSQPSFSQNRKSKRPDAVGVDIPQSQAPLEERLKAFRAQQLINRQKVTLFRAPFRTLRIFTIVAFRYTRDALYFVLSHQKLVTLFAFLSALLALAYYLPGEHQQQLRYFETTLALGGWWVLLGILSSVGLGSGLHTFMLYLGPFIAKVTMAAYECRSLDFDTYGANSFICPEGAAVTAVTMFNILRKVQFEALLWGAGTAIGELPPYFVARAAALAGQKDDEIEEELAAHPNSYMPRIKARLHALLLRFGFFGILLFASIPNPLFDLAGVTCGHFLVPFATFFGATFIGKALVKAHIQTVFVITIFNQSLLDYLILTIERSFPSFQGKIDAFVQGEKKKFHGGAHVPGHDSKGVLARMWDVFLIIMLLYFLVSIINSSVQSYLAEQDAKQIEQIEAVARKQKTK